MAQQCTRAVLIRATHSEQRRHTRRTPKGEMGVGPLRQAQSTPLGAGRTEALLSSCKCLSWKMTGAPVLKRPREVEKERATQRLSLWSKTPGNVSFLVSLPSTTSEIFVLEAQPETREKDPIEAPGW